MIMSVRSVNSLIFLTKRYSLCVPSDFGKKEWGRSQEDEVSRPQERVSLLFALSLCGRHMSSSECCFSTSVFLVCGRSEPPLVLFRIIRKNASCGRSRLSGQSPSAQWSSWKTRLSLGIHSGDRDCARSWCASPCRVPSRASGTLFKSGQLGFVCS